MAKCKPAGALHFGELTGRARTSAPPSAPYAAGPPVLPPRCRITYTRAWPIRSALPPTDRSHHLFSGPGWYDFIME